MTREIQRIPISGWPPFIGLSLATLAGGAALIWFIAAANRIPGGAADWETVVPIVASVAFLVILIILWCGLFTLQPNQSSVLVLFGAYRGTVKKEGFHWANPFFRKIKISLRARTLNGEKLKVNDQRGNPIEIAAVVVWRVDDTTRAVFDVDDYVSYVMMQSETSVRHLASVYPYDSHEDGQVSLRGSMEEISRALRIELQERLSKAGVTVEEARLSHLAYSPEIAGVMLRRQQAEAVVAARTRIVEGAMGMVQLALAHMEKDKIVELDSERKAAMVSNLLVVLCGEQAAQPIVNTGSLYS